MCTRADEALRDRFKLTRWIDALSERHELYFEWCDRAFRDLRLLNGGGMPKDESLVLLLTAALAEDDSFAGHARGNRQAEFLTDDANWDKLYRAGAAAILEAYLGAVESGRWP